MSKAKYAAIQKRPSGRNYDTGRFRGPPPPAPWDLQLSPRGKALRQQALEQDACARQATDAELIALSKGSGEHMCYRVALNDPARTVYGFKKLSYAVRWLHLHGFKQSSGAIMPQQELGEYHRALHSRTSIAVAAMPHRQTHQRMPLKHLPKHHARGSRL